MAGDTSETVAFLPYHEPGIIPILTQASFLLLLNIANAALDRVLYCGLLGQVLVGVLFGSPGAKWLATNVEETIVQLGYLGLILLVYEGGLHTSFQSLKANLLLSACVAATGIALPIGLSYTLQGLLDATPIQAFAAGAALCSTSLGTTFAVLASSGLSTSRLGVVLTSAAMMDDVVGLIMVQVISNLGGDDFTWLTVARPVFVSIAFAVIVPLACLFVAKPLTLRLNLHREKRPTTRFNAIMRRAHTAFTLHTLLLIGLVTSATYAGTSNLFAAYVAGAVISWWDSEVPHPFPIASSQANEVKEKTSGKVAAIPDSTTTHTMRNNADDITPDRQARQNGEQKLVTEPSLSSNTQDHSEQTSGAVIYQQYYHPAVSKILQPFFFASIGFSIPITRMFQGDIVWRGIVYTILMAFGKLFCGVWLARFSLAPAEGIGRFLAKIKLPTLPHLWGKRVQQGNDTTRSGGAAPSPTHLEPRSSPNPPRPLSLHPPVILGLAMCARGEIGFLISGVAESAGVFSPSGSASQEPSNLFLVVTWAIVLCTVMGPLGVGLSVRRVKKLEERKNQQQEGTGRDVLGVWGMQ